MIVYSSVGDIITAALQELAILRADEVARPSQMAVGVKKFNLLLDELSVGLANLFVEAQDPFTLQAGVNPYTIGPGGVFNTAIPVKVDQAYLVIGGVNYPIDVTMTENEYREIPIPTQQSKPTRLWFQPGASLGSIYFDFVPDQNYSIVVFSFKALAKATNQNTALAYPDGYEAALVYNMAVRMAPGLGKKPSDITIALATRTLSAIENLNASRLIEPADFSDVPTRRSSHGGNIFDMGMG